MNNTINLTIEEYQEIRDAMFYAKGNIVCYMSGNQPRYPDVISKLTSASDILESARWRSPEAIREFWRKVDG